MRREDREGEKTYLTGGARRATRSIASRPFLAVPSEPFPPFCIVDRRQEIDGKFLLDPPIQQVNGLWDVLRLQVHFNKTITAALDQVPNPLVDRGRLPGFCVVDQERLRNRQCSGVCHKASHQWLPAPLGCNSVGICKQCLSHAEVNLVSPGKLLTIRFAPGTRPVAPAHTRKEKLIRPASRYGGPTWSRRHIPFTSDTTR